MQKDLTAGPITKTMLAFAGPMIAGNLLQQFYNIADSFVVGQFVGPDALAAVGSAYTLMTFLTSILIGLCMGSGAIFSFYFGKNEPAKMKSRVQAAFLLIGGISVFINILAFLFLDGILRLLQVPEELFAMMRSYVFLILFGIFFIFLYNFFAFLLRALGNSVAPLWFLGSTVVLNVGLDVLFVVGFRWGIEGAAVATVLSQMISGIGIAAYTFIKEPSLRFGKNFFRCEKGAAPEILRFSLASSAQQSVMNFGVLMVQGLVNSFGPQVMAAFAAAVKIDSFAYMPAQEFANAYSLFISQNFGAGKEERIRRGTKSAFGISLSYCAVISVLVFILAKFLMMIFISPENREIIQIGVGYLRVEGAFYCGIGLLFLLYGYFRGINRPVMSLVLTVISLGTRVALAYLLAPLPQIGVWGIWWAVPIGWALADITGLAVMGGFAKRRTTAGA
ncbi:MATE family efflux transporter [Fumia xinanensis]|uniref:Probable multidrug resistance protein NorM n=1 Tax=Fumia xinanensis TaxID=2763659 RepID=A0A926I2I6_9FIRM|nr:MATE family efflux transporter [Fumia xinanensis]MBC8559603.1 MATE family efflux transporter [Fumia xinanensis]